MQLLTNLKPSWQGPVREEGEAKEKFAQNRVEHDSVTLQLFVRSQSELENGLCFCFWLFFAVTISKGKKSRRTA